MSRTVLGGVPLDADQERVLAALLGMQRQSWEQGVTGHALLDLGRADLVRVLARDAVTRQTADGRLAEIDADGLVNSAPNMEVLRATGDPGLTDAYERQLRWLVEAAPRAADGTLFHLAGSRQVWVDTVYMVLPPLVAAGRADLAAVQLAGHRDRLFDPDRGLYAHQWDEDRGELVRPQLWGTGTGWVVAGIARAVRTPGAEAFRAAAVAHARVVIDACLSTRDPSGLFHDVLDDPESFLEANTGQLLAYAILTGVADGWLPRSYAGQARSMIATARAHVDPDGFVTPVCGAPRFDRPGVSAEAQAFFLLATAAERRAAGPDPG